MEGGVPEGHLVLVAGTPGTMKSSLCYYMLYNHALESGTTSVYVTLEQSRDSLLKQMEKMGMHTDQVDGQGPRCSTWASSAASSRRCREGRPGCTSSSPTWPTSSDNPAYKALVIDSPRSRRPWPR
ncbi:MAG: hypothetical protein MZV70_01345 [Desulfobacterales bacterium]|nr:hypothetical protein [Desulfobacterales bacterium]